MPSSSYFTIGLPRTKRLFTLRKLNTWSLKLEPEIEELLNAQPSHNCEH